MKALLQSKRIAKAVNGSISIFLVIVLVPVISVAGLIVDASRYQMAKSEVAAAADLTLNTALADYDTILKDVYGLFAVSQNDEQLQTNLKKYFSDMLISQGLAEGEADLASNQLLQNVVDASSGSTSNLLALTLDEGEDAFKVNGVEGSSLAEPSVLKNSIVEFCKYRTPVNAAFSILDGVSAFSKMAKQTKVTEKSAEVSEKLGDLNDACQKLYKATEEYEEYLSGVNATLATPDSAGAKTYEQWMREDVLPPVIEAAIVSDNVEVDIRQTNDDKAYPAGYQSFTIKVNGSTLSNSTLNETLTVRSGNASRTKTDDEVERDFKSALDAIRWSGRFDYDFNSLGYQDKIECLNDYQEYEKQVHRAWFYAKEYQSRVSGDAEKLKYFMESKDLSTFESKMISANELAQRDYRIDLTAADAALATVKGDYAAKITALTDLASLVEKCLKLAEEVSKKVGEVSDSNKEFRSAVNAYGTDDSFGAQMDAECSGYEQTINKESFNEFTEALASLKGYFESYLDHMKEYRVCDATIDSIDSAQALSNRIKASGWLGDHPESRTLDDLLSSVGQHCTFPSAFSARENLTLQDLGFYRYLKSAFGDTEKKADSEKETKKTLSDNAKTASEKALSTEGDEFANESVPTAGLPSQGGGDKDAKSDVNTKGMDSEKGYSSMLTNLSSMASQITSGIEKALVAGRDNLYMADYAFSMFSWCTQKNELAQEAKGAGGSVEPKTATGIDINATNNKLYGAEIEYILYGKATAKDNVSTAKAQIFVVRFACNSLYALTDSTINMQTLSPALAIQAASAGVIPYQLPQIVMKLALAMAESGIDLYELSEGKAVQLFKDGTTWHLGGDLSAAKEFVTGAAKKTFSEASSKLKGTLNALLDGATDKGVQKVGDLVEDIQASAEEQANKAIDGVFNAFTSSVESSLGPVLARLDYVNDNTAALAKEIIETAKQKTQGFIDQQDDGFVKSALQTAYDQHLLKESDNYVTWIIDTLQKAKASKTANGLISDLQVKIKDSLSSALKEAEKKVITTVKTETKKLTDTVKSELGDKIDRVESEANKKVAEKINTWFDDSFSGYTGSYQGSAGNASSGYLSCLKFKYSDYLKVFLYIKLCVNYENQVLRMADLIQINIANGLVDPAASGSGTHAQGEAFAMKKAYTYYELQASLGLKTMFLDLPMITKQMGVEDVSVFELSYHGAQGY